MDKTAVREHAEAHGQAVVDNDLGKAGGDLAPEVQRYAGDIMRELPRPVTSCEVVDVTGSEDTYTARIRYSGADKAVEVDSRWQEVEGRPQIVELKLT